MSFLTSELLLCLHLVTQNCSHGTSCVQGDHGASRSDMVLDYI